MLPALTLILACQLAGEAAALLLHLPVPGPVIGMTLLLALLVARGGIPKEIESVGDALLANLSLLFVPAGVGVMLHAPLMARDWLPISVALVVSTLVTIAVTALVMRRLAPEAAAAEISTPDGDGKQS